MNPNQPITNPDLLDYLQKNINNYVPETLMNLVYTSKLLIKGTYDNNVLSLDFLQDKLEDGTKTNYLQAFTDWGQVHEMTNLLVFDFSTIQQCFRQNTSIGGVVLNQMTYNIFLPRLWFVGEESSNKVQIGDPAEKPDSLINALMKLSSSNKEIDKIYLGQMIRNGERSYVVALTGTSDFDFNKILQDFQKESIDTDIPIDFVDSKSEIGKYLIYHLNPINTVE